MGVSRRSTQSPWAEHGNTERLARDRRRQREVLLLALVAVVAAVGIWAATRSAGHSGGDPGGRILNSLQPVKKVIPAGAADIDTITSDSTYSTKCPDNPGGKAGWSAVIVVSNFRSRLPSPDVVADIGNRLARLGWHRVAPVWDHNFDQYRPQAAWQKTLFRGQIASATVYQLPVGSGPDIGTWHFGANAKPPGYAVPGC